MPTIDINQPLEAVHIPTGRVVPVSFQHDRYAGSEGFTTDCPDPATTNGGWYPDGTDYCGRGEWYVRNVGDASERATIPEPEPEVIPEPEPEAAPEPARAFDVTLPLELDDGTPVEFVREDTSDGTVLVRLSEDSPKYDYSKGCQYYFHTDDGSFHYRSPSHGTLRNVDPSLSEAARSARRKWVIDGHLHPDFTGEDWFAPYAALHFPLLKEVEGVAMVSFYENERKLEADRRTEMRVGRYVRRFNGGKLKDEDVEKIAAASDVKLRGNRVKITQDADEIEQVYRHGPRSCMAGPASDFDTDGIHPARVYAGPDLAVAYLGEPNDASARVVIWPEKKRYSSIYGDYRRLSQMLDNMGYEEGDMYGARVQLIECDCGTVMPYVDGVSGASIEGNYAVLGRGHDLDCSSTNGLGSDSCRTTCGHCDDLVHDDDTYTVYLARHEAQTWCSSCRSDDATYCDFTDDYVADECMVEVVRSDGHSDRCAEWALERNDFVLVNAGSFDGQWVHSDLTITRGSFTYHEDDAIDGDEDDLPSVPRASLEEAEAAGQMALPLDTAGAFRLMGSDAQTGQTFPCVLRNAGGPASEYEYDGTYAECEENRQRITQTYQEPRYRYWIEPVNADAEFRVRRTGEGTTSHVWFFRGSRSLGRQIGTFAEAEYVWRTQTERHGERHTYIIEPHVAGEALDDLRQLDLGGLLLAA